MTDRALKAAGAAQRGGGDAGMHERAARVRRSAWLIGGCAVLVYVGYIAWMFLRAAGG